MQALLDEADAKYDNAWDKFDFLRNYILDNVVAAGPGTPASITPERVQEILGDTLEASPFEIVAMQAMLARWTGDPRSHRLRLRRWRPKRCGARDPPRHGASFVEVDFPGYGWLPVVGKPKQAKPTVGTDPGLQQTEPRHPPQQRHRGAGVPARP